MTNHNNTDDNTYNAKARQEIHDWRHPDRTVLDKSLAVLSTPIDKAGEALMSAPKFGDTLKQATEKTIVSLSDAANWTLDVQDTIEAYKNESSQNNDEAKHDNTSTALYAIKKLEDIQSLPLAVVDNQVKLFKSKYVALTSAQGVTTGVIGWAGIPADVVGLITANLRAISEYATYYGFDMSDKGEQLFAMSLLSIASSASEEARTASLKDSFDLVKDPETLAFNQINEEVVSRVLRQTATQVATNLVKTKAAQIVPAVGAVVAGGVNANYTAQVCEAAYQCYRERFLDRQALDAVK